MEAPRRPNHEDRQELSPWHHVDEEDRPSGPLVIR
jgi:hypothetical protein